jgi:thioredoxin reductase (NADPH)
LDIASEPVLVWGAALLIAGLIVLPYLLRFRRRVKLDRERKEEAAALGIDKPAAQFPYIDPSRCIGCGACVKACPEGEVLGVVGGTAVVVNGLKCVGHGRCEEACPVGAIQVGLGDLKSREDVPLLDDHYQTTVPGIYIVGELGGLSLVRNAAFQGRRVIEHLPRKEKTPGILDVAIVGAGPAGLSAGLTAATSGLSYAVFEREETLGGSLLHYPRRKMVLTQRVELPPWGALDREEYSKEVLLDLFEGLVRDHTLDVRFGESVIDIRREVQREEDGIFTLRTVRGEEVRTRAVVLALGRRGTPRKLGVPGEELSKVMYRLMDAEGYRDQKILVVGGGDSAAEAAIGLSCQTGNVVTLSYRRDKLVRLKKKNQDALDALLASGKIKPLFGSQPVEIAPDRVKLKVKEQEVELPNDWVFVFAGGVPPFDFLKKLGVRFGGA